MKVLDIGCGTGTSTYILSKLVGENGEVIGIDFSEQMLEIAKNGLRGKTGQEQPTHLNFEFINCDADLIDLKFSPDFDSVLYNASIFLLPEPENTLKGAYNVLKLTGIVGMNYLIGIHPAPETAMQPDDADLFTQSKSTQQPFAPYGRRINDVTGLKELIENIGYKNIRTGILSKKMSVDEILAFYSIPAQSAALWPKTPYEERLVLLNKLIEYLRELGFEEFYQHWGWITAIKS